MDIFRFMGMPDKVLGIEGLPEDFLRPFEMNRADGFPRHWKEFMGKRKKLTPIPPEKDPLTGLVRRFDPIVEEDSYFFLVDWNLKQNEEKWQELTDYVRKNVDRDVRLLDKIEDMAKPLARDKSEGVSLEPEDVPIIKINVAILPLIKTTVAKNEEKNDVVKCSECDYEGKSKQAVRMHSMKKHRKELAKV